MRRLTQENVAIARKDVEDGLVLGSWTAGQSSCLSNASACQLVRDGRGRGEHRAVGKPPSLCSPWRRKCWGGRKSPRASLSRGQSPPPVIPSAPCPLGRAASRVLRDGTLTAAGKLYTMTGSGLASAVCLCHDAVSSHAAGTTRICISQEELLESQSIASNARTEVAGQDDNDGVGTCCLCLAA